MIHGGNIYDRSGQPLKGLRDFSTTVCGRVPGLAARLKAAQPRLAAYPQPYSQALAGCLAQAHGLPQGAVLATHGSSEGLALVSRALSGPVALEDPCFPEYARLLKRQGRCITRVVAERPGHRPALKHLLQAIPKAGSLWLANPSSPAGQVLPLPSLMALWAACQARQSCLVLDESLEAQALDPLPSLLGSAWQRPGLLVLRSITKGLGLPGLRLGLVTGHAGLLSLLAQQQDPWTVDSMTQALGPWLAQQSLAQAPCRRLALRQAKAGLLEQLLGLKALGYQPLGSCTGYFLLRLPQGCKASRLSQKLLEHGFLVRDCASFGDWGQGYLRLNPQSKASNRALARVLAQEAGA